jgi:hypothetical protein
MLEMIFAVSAGEIMESTDGTSKNKNSKIKRAGLMPASL